MAACVERRAACGASYNDCASGATPCKFETRQPARPAGKARADRQFQRRVSRPMRQTRLYNHSMKHSDVEMRVQRVLRQLITGGGAEDQLVELKREWPTDFAKAARRIAGHANS